MSSDKTPSQERRFKIVSINQQFMVDVLNWWRNPPHWMALPITDALPEDCEVVSMSVSFERQCLEAIVASKNFPPCLEGSVIERIPGFVEFREVQFQPNGPSSTQGDEPVDLWQAERAKTQMTLGKLIDRLIQLNQSLEMDALCRAHSYRGYYADLAFELCGKRKVSTVLTDVLACVDKQFDGYKGGEFVMDRNTPVWIAKYENCGVRLIAINDDGTIVKSDDPHCLLEHQNWIGWLKKTINH